MIKLRFSQTGVDSDFSQNFCVKIRWVEALFLCYLTLFTQASMNLRNGHNVTQVDFVIGPIITLGALNSKDNPLRNH